MHDDMLTMDVKCVIEVEENKAFKVEWYDINVTIKFIDWDGVEGMKKWSNKHCQNCYDEMKRGAGYFFERELWGAFEILWIESEFIFENRNIERNGNRLRALVAKRRVFGAIENFLGSL